MANINNSFAENKRQFPEWDVAKKARRLKQVRIVKKNSAVLKNKGRSESKKSPVDSDLVRQSSHHGDADRVHIFRGPHDAGERNAEKLKKPRETKSDEKDGQQSAKPRGKRTRTSKKTDVVIKKAETEEDEPKRYIKRRNQTEKLLTKKPFDISRMTYFRQITKNLRYRDSFMGI